MTKLDYRKLPEPDPARVVEVRESGVWCGNDKHPFETEAQRRERHREARRKREAATAIRSEKLRYKAIIRKHGYDAAARLGVPNEFIESAKAAEAQAMRDKERTLAAQVTGAKAKGRGKNSF